MTIVLCALALADDAPLPAAVQAQTQALSQRVDALANYIADKKAAEGCEVDWEQPPLEEYQHAMAPSSFLPAECVVVASQDDSATVTESDPATPTP